MVKLEFKDPSFIKKITEEAIGKGTIIMAEDTKPKRTRQRTRKDGTLSVRRAHYDAAKLIDETETIEKVDVPFFGDVEVGRVRVGGSVTRNMGDYNSVRVEVSFELPCLPELSEANRVYDIASKFVDGKIKKELDCAVNEREEHDAPSSAPEFTGIRRQINV